MDTAARARELALLGIEVRGHPHPGQHYHHGWIPVTPRLPDEPEDVDSAEEEFDEFNQDELPSSYREKYGEILAESRYGENDNYALVKTSKGHGLHIADDRQGRDHRRVLLDGITPAKRESLGKTLGGVIDNGGAATDPATGVRVVAGSRGKNNYAADLTWPGGETTPFSEDAVGELTEGLEFNLVRSVEMLRRSRMLALLGIEVRATQSENTGTGGGYQPPHVPAGSSKGGQFGTTAGTATAPKGYQSILPPASAYQSGGGGKKKSGAAPANTPQAPTTSRTMKVGDSGEDVRYAQYAMKLVVF
jgi:hypothetical protein